MNVPTREEQLKAALTEALEYLAALMGSDFDESPTIERLVNTLNNLKG